MSKKSTVVKADKKTPPSPIRPPKKTEVSLRCNFTEKELLEIGRKLAEANRELSQAEEEKKAVTSQLKAKCDSIAGRIEQHSGELTSGYTYKSVPCEVRYDSPDKGQKTIFRLDINEVVKVEAMTLSEMQAELPLTNESPKPETARDVRRTVAADGVVATPGDGDVFLDESEHKL